jgi:hypothetical protein
MPIANVVRLSIQGLLPGGEEWSVNPVYDITTGDFGPNIDQAQALAAATAAAAVTVPGGVTGLLSSACNFQSIKLEARRYDGTLAAQAEAAKGSPQLGNGGATNPLQMSLVTSLRTAGFGASSRGRLYWPATGLAIATGTHRISSVNVSAVLTGIKAYLASLQTAIATPLGATPRLAVWSRKNNSAQLVTSIQSGDVPDVQRRRRDALIEAYTALPWP